MNFLCSKLLGKGLSHIAHTDVAGVLLELLRETKVTDFGFEIGGEKNVPGG